MPRHDALSGIQEGLNLSKHIIEHTAESAFLNLYVAKDPYPPQLEFCNSHKHIKSVFGANQSGKCLRAESKMLMWSGQTEMIKDVRPGDIVSAYDFDSKMFVPALVTDLIENDAMPIHRFRHDFGILECTKSHRVCAFNSRTKTHRMIRAMRAVKNQEEVVLRDKQGAPFFGNIHYEGFAAYEPTYDITIAHKDHAFVCNDIVVSNSHAAAFNIAWDATGLYPDWYRGPKTTRGIDAWVLGDTVENTRDAPQKKLFGPDIEKPGWTDKPGKEALIHSKYIIGKPSRKSTAGAIDMVRVKHVPSDTVSTITFKTHGMEMQALASWSGDRAWIDEEPPKEILDEIVARMTTTNGYIYITLCPQHGNTPLVKFLKDGADGPDVFLTYLTDEDAKHISPEVRERNRRLWASNPAMLAARSRGQAVSNSGLIFRTPTDKILYSPSDITISPRWKYLGGLDVGWRHPTAAVAGAWDPMSDTIYVYASYEVAEMPYLYHHSQLMRWGANMTFMIDPASFQSSQADGTKILEELWKLSHGENYLEIEENKRKYIRANRAFMPTMDAMFNRLESGRLRFSKNLGSLVNQYNDYEWNSDGDGPARETPTRRYDIITACRYMVYSVVEHAHSLDIAPWSEGMWENPIEIPEWRPYRCGGNEE